MVSAFHDYVFEDDEEDSEQETGQTSGAFNESAAIPAPPTPVELQLSRLMNKLKDPNLSTEGLQNVLEQLTSLEQSDAVMDYLRPQLFDTKMLLSHRILRDSNPSAFEEYLEELRRMRYLGHTLLHEREMSADPTAANDPTPSWNGMKFG